ncbi:MAG: hypothetical protein ACRBHB_13675 [Arenicella sp.]
MKKLFLIKLLVITILSCTSISFADRNASRPLLTNEQKLKEIDEFVEFDKKHRAREQKKLSRYAKGLNQSLASKGACQGEEKSVCENSKKSSQENIERIEKLHRHLVQGRHEISIVYINDNNFSHVYYSAKPQGDLSEDEARRYELKVLNHYLGREYEVFEPRLFVATADRIGIDIYLTPDELRHFASDGRIFGLYAPPEQSYESRN